MMETPVLQNKQQQNSAKHKETLTDMLWNTIIQILGNKQTTDV